MANAIADGQRTSASADVRNQRVNAGAVMESQKGKSECGPEVWWNVHGLELGRRKRMFLPGGKWRKGHWGPKFE